MIVKELGKIALAMAASFIGVGIAQADEPLERSGNVYHRAVCSRAIGQGEARCHAHIRVDAHGNPFTGTPNAGSGTPSGYSPGNLWSAYFGASQAPLTGTIVAIVDAYGYANAESDLAVYRSHYGLGTCSSSNGCFKRVNQNGVSGSYPNYNAGWAQEQALDLDMVSAMCPKCTIILVEAKSASFSNLNAAVAEAALLGAKVISNSYGGADGASTNYDLAFPAYINAANKGVAVTASSGDSGFGAQFPATSEYVIAVGGTSLTKASNARGWSEAVWSGTGSGCSSLIAQPAWQNYATNPNTYSAYNNTSCLKRIETDISAVADPATGVAVYGPSGIATRSAWLVFGGTSVAAPLIGGMYGTKGGVSSGTVGPQQIWVNAPSGLNDVTTGSNGSCVAYCAAGVGYDSPSGNGTPNGTGGL